MIRDSGVPSTHSVTSTRVPNKNYLFIDLEIDPLSRCVRRSGKPILACLHADGRLAEGQTWRQESIAGTIFDGSVNVVDGKVRPTIRSTGHITADSMLIIDQRDPLTWGLS